MTTIYPTFNWRDFALRLARDIREGDTDGMEDGAKDALQVPKDTPEGL